jgi:hypothetical protein
MSGIKKGEKKRKVAIHSAVGGSGAGAWRERGWGVKRAGGEGRALLPPSALPPFGILSLKLPPRPRYISNTHPFYPLGYTSWSPSSPPPPYLFFLIPSSPPGTPPGAPPLPFRPSRPPPPPVSLS